MWRILRHIRVGNSADSGQLLPGLSVGIIDGFEGAGALAEVVDSDEVQLIELHHRSLHCAVAVMTKLSYPVVGCSAAVLFAPEDEVEDVQLGG